MTVLVGNSSDLEPVSDTAGNTWLLVDEPSVCFKVSDIQDPSDVQVAAKGVCEQIFVSRALSSLQERATLSLKPRHF